MDKHPKTIIDRITTPGWTPLPRDVRKEFAVRNVGDGPPGLYQLLVLNGDPDGYFDPGQQVGVVADAPAIGWVFDQWTGDIDELDNPLAAETFIIMPPNNVQIEAGYIPGVYNLTVNNGTGSGAYSYNQSVPISADPPPSELHEFDVWTGDTAGIVSINEPNTNIIMPPSDAVINATYKLIYYDLIVNQGEGDGNYLKGTIVNISADPPAFNKTFGGWDGDISTITSPHLPYTTIDMQGNYEITATYDNIIPFDPDIGDGYYDINQDIGRDSYNGDYLRNTPLNPDIDRYFDSLTKNSRITFKDTFAIGLATPGGGKDVNASLVIGLDTDLFFGQMGWNYEDYAGMAINAASPGGGRGVKAEVIDIEDVMFWEGSFNGEQDTFKFPITYAPYEGLQEIIADADTLIQSGFAGGEVTLGALRDNSLGNTGIYTTTPVGDYIGAGFPSARNLAGMQWYSLARNGRIEDFTVERYDGGAWTKVPITAVGSLVTIINTDEGQADNVNGWMTLYWTPVMDSAVRIKCGSYYNGDANCGVSEMRIFEQV